jgi:hypothetical protein
MGDGRRQKLSATVTGQKWVLQFAERDRSSATAMLDALLLLNEEEVAASIRGLLQDLAAKRSGPRKRIGLYAAKAALIVMKSSCNIAPARLRLSAD